MKKKYLYIQNRLGASTNKIHVMTKNIKGGKTYSPFQRAYRLITPVTSSFQLLNKTQINI